MSSYQVSVEFDFNQESSNSDLSKTADVILKVPVKVRFSRNQMPLTRNHKVLMWMSLSQTTIESPNAAEEVQETKQRNQALQNRFDNIKGLDAWSW